MILCEKEGPVLHFDDLNIGEVFRMWQGRDVYIKAGSQTRVTLVGTNPGQRSVTAFDCRVTRYPNACITLGQGESYGK